MFFLIICKKKMGRMYLHVYILLHDSIDFVRLSAKIIVLEYSEEIRIEKHFMNYLKGLFPVYATNE